MKLIVGLGNPEAQYNLTRHNFGFLALDFYAKIHHLEWQKPKFGAVWLKTNNTIFIKPQNYYNASGEAVQAFLHFYKLTPDDLLIVCDDFDLPFGTIRYRAQGSSAGNNGLTSIINQIGTSAFPRLRLGTNAPQRQVLGDIKFVLGKFTPEEKTALPDLLMKICQKIDESIDE